MRPKANNLHHPFVFEHLIHQPVLNIDTARIGAGQIAHELFVRWRILVGVLSQNFEQGLRLLFKSGGGKFFGVFLRLVGVTQRPIHQRSSLRHFDTRVFNPRRMDARMPGIESRCRVS